MINIKTEQVTNINEKLGDWNVGTDLFTKEVKLFGLTLWKTCAEIKVETIETKHKFTKVGFKNEK